MCLEFAEFLTLDHLSLFNVLNSRPKEKEITNVVIYNIRKYKSLALLGIRCYLCKKVGHVATTCKKFVFIVDKEDAVKRADARKYMNRKSVNLNNKTKPNFERIPVVAEQLKRHDHFSAKGEPFELKERYWNHPRIINRALSIQGQNRNLLNTNRLTGIKEGQESEENETDKVFSQGSLESIKSLRSDHSSDTYKSVTFGK
jgi:hypothetical protein